MKYSLQLYEQAQRDLTRALGHLPATEQTWTNMCLWLEGWYMREGVRVKVRWETFRTHRALLKVIDLDSGRTLDSVMV